MCSADRPTSGWTMSNCRLHVVQCNDQTAFGTGWPNILRHRGSEMVFKGD